MKVKRIFGPSYQYDGEVLTEPTMIWVEDHPHDQSIDALEQLVASGSCDANSHLIVFSCLTDLQEPATFQWACIPGPHMFQNDDFIKRGIEPNWNNKNKSFNFMLNKVRPHRILLAKMINYFQLQDYVYSLAWQYNFNFDDPTTDSIVDPLIRQQISESTLPNYNTFLNDSFDYTDNHIKVKLNHVKHRSLPGELGYDNAFSYQNQLKHNLFEPSYVSLISEPIYDVKAVMITEKTTMAIWGGTVPIWVGGWNIANEMKKIGFDVFEDLIDHSYQTLPNAFDRCYFAIKLNLNVLKNQQLLKDYFENNKSRFEHNLNLCQSNYLKQYRLEHCKKYPVLFEKLKNKDQVQISDFF